MKKTAAAFDNVIISRRLLLGGSLALFSTAAATAAEKLPRRKIPDAPPPYEPLPQVYLLRGFANVLSRGIDKIGKELEARGVNAHVQGHLTWQSVAEKLISRHKIVGPSKILLVGHSLGANAVIGVAEKLDKVNISVDYLATFAATYPDPLPGNIKRAVNFYFSSNGWGRALVAGPAFKGTLNNVDFANRREVGHFNIDKQPALQAEVVSDILDIIYGG